MDRETQRLLERVTVDLEPPRGLADVKARAHQRHVRARVIAGVTAVLVAAVGVGGSIAVLDKKPPAGAIQESPTPRPLARNGQIALVRSSALGEGIHPNETLVLVDPLGLSAPQVTNIKTGSAVSWSPDGSRLAYTYAGLWTTSQDATDQVNILPCGGPPCSGLGYPAWSPDGTRLAFWMDYSKRGEGVWLIDKDGSNLRLLTPGLSVGQPTWSPDGSEIAVAGSRLDSAGQVSESAIFLLDPTTGQILRTLRTAGLEPSFGISWSPDGRRLAFDAFGSGGSNEGAGIYFIDPDGADMTLVVSWDCPSGACTARTPQWSPDGRYLAFTATMAYPGGDGLTGEIRVMDLQSERTQVLTRGKLDCCPAWQPLAATRIQKASLIRKRITDAEATYGELAGELRHARDALARARVSGDVVRVQTALARVMTLKARQSQTRARIENLMQLLSQRQGGNASPSPSIGPTGFPPVTVTPTHGPVGTHIRIEGDGFTGPDWVDAAGGYGVFILRGLSRGCELIAGTNGSVHVDGTGHLVAHVTVSSTGSCFQSNRKQPVRPGTYQIGVACHACELGTFIVDPTG